MTETVDTPLKPRTKAPTKIVVIVLPVLLLLLAYGAGIIFLPVSVLTNYQNRNCSSALNLHSLYTKLYPRSMQDTTLTAPVEECKAYARAVSTEEKESWQEAYDAYQAYVSTYPNGLYLTESHEHSAIALIQISKSQAEEGQYRDAISNLDLILVSYSDTSAYAEAVTLVPSTYQAWEADLREVGNFETAVQVLNDFKVWSQSHQNSDADLQAQSELVQTYLQWGMSLQSQKQFEAALAKFDLAVTADPESKFDSTAQVKSAQRKTFVEWGNQFLEQKDFQAAIEKFNLAVSHSQGENDDGVRDALSNGYIQWAKSLSAAEDFRGALEQMELVKQAAVSDGAKQTVETALDEIYLAFSNSTGKQAQRAMKDALEAICKKNKKPDLPIFGLDKDSVRVALYGVDDKLPEDLVARTPGEMHYAVCVDVGRETINSDRRYFRVRDTTIWTYFVISRVKLSWNINVHNSMADDIANRVFEGGDPPPAPPLNTIWGNTIVEGDPPSMNGIVEWLRSVIQ